MIVGDDAMVATVAPASASGSHFDGVRFQTVTLWPLASKASESALPIMPIPITQTSWLSFDSFIVAPLKLRGSIV